MTNFYIQNADFKESEQAKSVENLLEEKSSFINNEDISFENVPKFLEKSLNKSIVLKTFLCREIFHVFLARIIFTKI